MDQIRGTIDCGGGDGGEGGAESISDQVWGAVATNVPDPPACIAQCRRQFLEAVAPFYNDDSAESGAKTLPRLCDELSNVRSGPASASSTASAATTKIGFTNESQTLQRKRSTWRVNSRWSGKRMRLESRRTRRGQTTPGMRASAGSGTGIPWPRLDTRNGIGRGDEGGNRERDETSDDHDGDDENDDANNDSYERNHDPETHDLRAREQGDPRLWQLYCCDHSHCGVAPNETGQDPNVNRIINECQAIDRYVYDPGRPSVCQAAWVTVENSTATKPPGQAQTSNACPAGPRKVTTATTEPSIRVQAIPGNTNTGTIAPESDGPHPTFASDASSPSPSFLVLSTVPESAVSTPQPNQSTDINTLTPTQSIVSIAAEPSNPAQTSTEESATSPFPVSAESDPSPTEASGGTVSAQALTQPLATPNSETIPSPDLTTVDASPSPKEASTDEPAIAAITTATSQQATPSPESAVSRTDQAFSDPPVTSPPGAPTMAPVPGPADGDLTGLESAPVTSILAQPSHGRDGSSSLLDSSNSPGLSQGARAGLIVSIIAIVLAISALIFCLFRRRRRRTRGERLSSSGDDPSPSSGKFHFLSAWGRNNRHPGGIRDIRDLIRHPTTGSRNVMSPSPLIAPPSGSGNSVFGAQPDGEFSRDRDASVSFDAGGGIGGMSSAWSARRRSSTSGVPLTPPPRLTERRMLSLTLSPQPTAGESRDSQDWPHPDTDAKYMDAFGGPLSAPASLSPKTQFPSSPICSPTSAKLYPRYERAHKMYGLGATGTPLSSSSVTLNSGQMPLFTFPDHAFPLPHESFHSLSGVPVMGAASPFPSSTPPLSPVRPPRPHEAPLEIPDLVTPNSHRMSPGPPPNRDLPAIPMPAATSGPPPISSHPAMATSRYPNLGGAHGPARSSNVQNAVPPSGPGFPRGGPKERATGEPRGSWGNWSVMGGNDGGFGVALTTGRPVREEGHY